MLAALAEKPPASAGYRGSDLVQWLFQTAGKIVSRDRQTFLKISAAVLAVFIAIRGRCAGFIQEGAVTPETS